MTLPLFPFYEIFKQPLSLSTLDYLKGLKKKCSHAQMMDFFFCGGYPEPAFSHNYQFYQNWMENYYRTYIQRDIRKLFPRLNVVNYRRFIAMLSSLSGTIINRSELGRSLDTSEVTVKDYQDIAQVMMLTENFTQIPAGLV